MHVAMADQAVRIGPPPSQQSYLKGDTILSVARETGCPCVFNLRVDASNLFRC